MWAALSSSSSPSPAGTDDISVFLRQILLRPSSFSSSTLMAQKNNGMQCLSTSNVMLENPQGPVQFGPCSGPVAESSSGLNPVACVSVTPANVSSSSVGTVDYEIEEYECESEEDLVEEAAANVAASRSSSKRGRAAAVHNLSEKRRRSRINEKMKALQNLIPNSNKTDKASMLDEAIEYLKQLQLQVQMLTMRNGFNLYPMCLSGSANPYKYPHMKMGVYENDVLPSLNKAEFLPDNQDIMLNGLPGHYTIPKQTSGTNNLLAVNTTSFGWESSHVGSFQLPGSSKVIHGEEALSCLCINENLPSADRIDYHAAPDLKGNALQALLLGRYQSENEHLEDLKREAVLLP